MNQFRLTEPNANYAPPKNRRVGPSVPDIQPQDISCPVCHARVRNSWEAVDTHLKKYHRDELWGTQMPASRRTTRPRSGSRRASDP